MGRSHPDEAWALAATILASSMAFIDGTALNVALPVIQAGLGATGSQLLWVANAYLVALSSMILTGGSLGDRFGKKRVLAAGISLFTAASCACGLAPSVGFLIAARALQGLGGSLMIPGSLALLSSSVDPSRRGRAIGSWSAATTLVTLVGPALGGALSDLGLWRAVFLINLPLGVLTLVLLRAKVEGGSERGAAGIDLPGSALAALALGALAYAFIEAPRLGFRDARILAALAAGAAAGLGFVLAEKARKAPMLPLRIFSSRAFAGANLLTFFLYGGLSAASFFLALDLVQAQGYTKTQAGLASLPSALELAFLSRWAGAAADRAGPKPFLVAGPAIAGLGFLLLSFAGVTAGPRDYWTAFLPGILLLGLGMGVTVAPLTATVMGALDQGLAGTASGVNNAVARSAGALAIAALGSAALFSFSGSLSSAAARLGLGPAARAALVAQAPRLGAALPPPGLSPARAAEAGLAIARSFAASFGLVLRSCAALAIAGSLSAAVILEPGKGRSGAPPPRGP